MSSEPAAGVPARRSDEAGATASDDRGEPGAPLAGVRVVEVSTHVFVPMAGAVLSEWGAEVIKIEHPRTGDPYRGVTTGGLSRASQLAGASFQAANRGKRSVALDLGQETGRNLLGRLLELADVFTTSLRPESCAALGIDVPDVRADNPDIIYVRGSAYGPEGPEAARGGYDVGTYWARSGMQYLLSDPAASWPAQPRPAFGDGAGAMSIVAAIVTALFRRAASGHPSVVNCSLLAAGMWQVQADVVSASYPGAEREPPLAIFRRDQPPNPLMLPYRTADGRFVMLTMLTPDPYWPGLCEALGHPEVAGDERFVDMAARQRNGRECVAWLEQVFARRTLAEWREALSGFAGQWDVVQAPHELREDVQVRANGYLVDVDAGGTSVPMVAVPGQFDDWKPRTARAPEHGEDTEDVLLSMGIGWEEIARLKSDGTIV